MDIKLQPNITGTNVNLVKGATQADLTNAVNNAKIYRDEAQAFSIVSEDKSIESAYSALNASVSATTAIDKANIATNKATEANNSAINASASESVCIAKATIATDNADIATAQAVIATNKATEANTSANTANTQANIAIAKASEASISASNALTSENNADTSEANALIYRNQAESFANSINPSDLVHISGTETITGNKTFSGTVNGLTKATVGLSNVDNTSDANKPISTATQTALNTKVDKVASTDNAVVRFNGTTGEMQNSGVYVDDSNNVGIGTSSPATVLNANTTSDTKCALYIQKNLSSIALLGAESAWLGAGTSNNAVLAAYGTNSLILGTNAAERMRINTAGNVGIGNTIDNGTRRLYFQTADGGTSAIESISAGATNQVLVFKTTYVTESEKARLDGIGNLLLTSGTGGFGYGAGAGGTVTQLTSKSTAVTLNKPSGRITMNNSALEAGTFVEFTFNNSLITSSDSIHISFVGTQSNNYSYRAKVLNGVSYIIIKNESAGSLSEAIMLNFTIIKGAAA